MGEDFRMGARNRPLETGLSKCTKALGLKGTWRAVWGVSGGNFVVRTEVYGPPETRDFFRAIAQGYTVLGALTELQKWRAAIAPRVNKARTSPRPRSTKGA